MTGRHRAPADHHVAKAVVGTSLAVATTTGSLAVVSPVQASPSVTSPSQGVPVRVATSLLPVSAVVPVPQYTVQRGDTLGGVASRFGETWRQLYADNVAVIGADPNRIYPNQVLTVTGTPASDSAPVGRHAVGGQHAVDIARQYLGTPYAWGGATPGGFDCSGLVQYVYAQLGVSLPHHAADQATRGDRVDSLTAAQPGDLLFFDSPVDHVGIYIGNGQMVAAPTYGDVVKVQSVYATPSVIRRVL